MYFKRKSNILFRNYGSFGYITDNRNFSYKQQTDTNYDIGDKIISQSGTIFFEALSYNPQNIEEIVELINLQFTNISPETIKNDALEFYYSLEKDGFITSAETSKECNIKDTGFSYRQENSLNSSSSFVPFKENEKLTQEYFDEYYQGNPQLTNLHIEITSKCNEMCLHCYIPPENKIEEMNSDLFYYILDQSKKMNLLHLTISGGEPMIHRNFIDFLKKCRESNFSVNVLSNLTLLDDSILEEFKKNKLLGVQVSLYSMDPLIHDSITQIVGSFYKTKNAILKLIANDIPLQISCPIMRQNSNCYLDVVKWGKEHNVNVISDYVIIARYNHTTNNLFSRLSKDEVKKIMETKIKDDPQYLNNIGMEAEIKKNLNLDDPICSVCHSSICISESGNVYPCAGWQDYIVGNIHDKTLGEIWNNSEKVNYLRNLKRRDFTKCIECLDRDFCTMCMVRNANEHPFGDPLVLNEYFCSIVKTNKDLIVGIQKNSISSDKFL